MIEKMLAIMLPLRKEFTSIAVPIGLIGAVVSFQSFWQLTSYIKAKPFAPLSLVHTLHFYLLITCSGV